MNRFLRTAYSVIFVYLFATLVTVMWTNVDMPILALLCLLSGLLIALLPEIAPRLSGKEAASIPLGILTALLGFLPIRLFGCPSLHYIAYGLGILTAIVCYFIFSKSTTHSAFMERFKLTVIMAAVIVFFLFLLVLPVFKESGIVHFGFERIPKVAANIIPVFIMLLATGVLLLRGLRSEEGTIDQRQFTRRQVRDLMLFAIGVALVSMLDPIKHVTKALVFLYHNAFLPALKWVGMLIAAVIEWLFAPVPRTDHSYIIDNTPEPIPSETIRPQTTWNPTAVIPYEKPDINPSDSTLLLIVISVAAVVLAAVFIFVLRKKLRNRRPNRGYPNETVEEIEEEQQEREPAPKKRSADPRMKVRYHYMEFMKYLIRSSVNVKKTDTCGEIGENAKAGLRAENGKLDEIETIYEHARYRMNEPPTPADAERMKSILEDVRGAGRI